MKVGKPDVAEDAETAPPRERSLVERLAAWRGGAAVAGAGDPRIAVVVALLIAAGPVLTIVGAHLLATREQVEASRIEADLAPRIAAVQAAESARAELAPVLRRKSLAQLLEAMGRALPPEARLVRLERTAQGALEFDIASPDPDKLRMALRRVPEFAQVRNIGQRQADAGMVVSFLGGAE